MGDIYMERKVGTISRGIRCPIIRQDDNLADIVVQSVLEAAESEESNVAAPETSRASAESESIATESTVTRPAKETSPLTV
jgi:hypothetical protein